jgi:hypothetical protein
MIPQTFQAFLMAQEVDGDGSGVTYVIYDFDVSNMAGGTLFETLSASNASILYYGANTVDTSAAFTENGAGALRFQAQQMEVTNPTASPTSDAWTVEFSVYCPASSIGGGGGSFIQIPNLEVAFGVTAQFDIIDYNVVYPWSVLLTLNAWNRLAFVISKTLDYYAVYLDGTRVYLSDATPIAPGGWTIDNFVFGHSGTMFNTGFPTYMDNLRISTGARYLLPTYTLPTLPFTS